MNIEGASTCEWTEPGTKSVRRFLGEEKYINFEKYLIGDKDSESVEVPIGIHSYKFRFQLPAALPYSVEGEFGHIRYKIEAKLDISWSLCDLHAKTPFTIARNEDLNLFPELRIAQEIEEVKKFCWGLCDSKPLSVKIRLSKSGFALGENIRMLIEYNNMSNHNVENTIISLSKKEKYICSDPVKKDRVCKTKIVETTADGVRGNSEAKIEHLLQIPQTLMTSNRRYSQVYQIMYELKFIVVTDGCSSSPILKMPITIGSIAIRDVPFN